MSEEVHEDGEVEERFFALRIISGVLWLVSCIEVVFAVMFLIDFFQQQIVGLLYVGLGGLMSAVLTAALAEIIQLMISLEQSGRSIASWVQRQQDASGER